MTRIYHPNVKSDSGEICSDIFNENWGPTLNVTYVLNTIRQASGVVSVLKGGVDLQGRGGGGSMQHKHLAEKGHLILAHKNASKVCHQDTAPEKHPI